MLAMELPVVSYVVCASKQIDCIKTEHFSNIIKQGRLSQCGKIQSLESHEQGFARDRALSVYDLASPRGHY